jgi:hypothetical protein
MGRRRLLAVSIALALVLAAGASGSRGSEFTFYPQAGILWQDFVDLDPGPAIAVANDVVVGVLADHRRSNEALGDAAG